MNLLMRTFDSPEHVSCVVSGSVVVPAAVLLYGRVFVIDTPPSSSSRSSVWLRYGSERIEGEIENSSSAFQAPLIDAASGLFLFFETEFRF